MANPSHYLDHLVKELSRLPGIGPKSAARLAFHFLDMRDDDVSRLLSSVTSLRENITTCTVCGGISDADVCSICCDSERDFSIVCVVEHRKDVLTIEGTGEYRGMYHVLNGVISPLDGIGPEELNFRNLEKRCEGGDIKELILALNPSVEGDATTLYIAGVFRDMGIRVSRIAHGLPVGSDIEFADSATIVKSIEGRSTI